MPIMRTQRRRQSGSAFILVLMALVVLTIIGLALASTTQTEMYIGSNERTHNRVFYAADGGAALLFALKGVAGERDARTFVVPDSVVNFGGSSVRDQTELSALLPIQSAPCNLCQINNETAYTPQKKRVVFAYSSTGRRVGVNADGIGTTTVASTFSNGMLDMQPVDDEPAVPDMDPCAAEKTTKPYDGGVGSTPCDSLANNPFGSS